MNFIGQFAATGKPWRPSATAPGRSSTPALVNGKKVTSWPSLKTDLKNAGANWVDQEVVKDGQLIFSRKPDDIPAFNQAIIESVSQGAHHKRRCLTSQSGSRPRPVRQAEAAFAPLKRILLGFNAFSGDRRGSGSPCPHGVYFASRRRIASCVRSMSPSAQAASTRRAPAPPAPSSPQPAFRSSPQPPPAPLPARQLPRPQQRRLQRIHRVIMSANSAITSCCSSSAAMNRWLATPAAKSAIFFAATSTPISRARKPPPSAAPSKLGGCRHLIHHFLDRAQ